MDIVFDPVGETDAHALLVMARAFHDEDGHALDQMGEAAVLQVARGEPLARAWMLRHDRAAVGYVVITLGYSIEYGRDGFVDDLYVVPEARGRGLGKKLLDFTITAAIAMGIRTLHLELQPANEHAGRLYRRAGFEATNRRLMRLRLSS